MAPDYLAFELKQASNSHKNVFQVRKIQIKYLNWKLDRRLDSRFALLYCDIPTCHFNCQFKLFGANFPVESYRIKIAIIYFLEAKILTNQFH